MQTDPVDPVEFPWLATLVYGTHYCLALGTFKKDEKPEWKVFEEGVTVPVTENQREHLEEHAVQNVLNPGHDPEFDYGEEKLIVRQMFKFAPNVSAATAPTASPAPRQRPRVAA